MYYNSHCSTRSDGGAPNRERVSSQPPIQRRNSLARLAALGLLLGNIALPVQAGTALNGTAFFDLNGNGKFDPCEFPLSNKQIFISDLTLVNSGQSGLFSVVTDKTGKYSFNSENTGGFNLWVDIPSSQTLTAPIAASGSFRIAVSNISGQITPIDFGFFSTSFKNTPPSVAISLGTAKVEANTPVTFTATVTDADGDTLCGSSVPAWDFGDNTSEQGGLTASHTYTMPGTYTATVKVIDKRAGVGQASVSVVVESPAKPEMKISTSSVNYGDKLVNTRNYQYITVSNVGNAPLQLGTIDMGGANSSDFAKYDGCSNRSLAPSAACWMYTVFQPTSIGQKTASLTIPSDSASTTAVRHGTRAGSRDTVTLEGSGTPPPDGSGSQQQWCRDATDSNPGATITIRAMVDNGYWFDPQTWNTNQIPSSTDVVFIPKGITVQGPRNTDATNYIEIASLCNKGIIKGTILTTPTTKQTNSLEIYATNTQHGISNYGMIKGADGDSASSSCDLVGGDVLLIAGQKTLIQFW